MFSIFTSKLFGGLSIALALFAGLCWHKWGVWKDKAEAWEREADTVVIALRTASDNPKLKWKDAANQALALGDEKRQWKAVSDRQSAAIRDMAEETARLRARGAELKRIAEAAQAKRRAALDRLEQMALTPGERADCETLLREANEALDLAYQGGL